MKNLKELFFTLILCSSLGNAQLATEKQTLLLRTFGFIQGQQNTLNIIKLNFPRQSINANLAELAFNKKYHTAINNIDLEVKKIYGSSFDNYLTNLKSTADEYFKSTKMSENDAILFVQGVQNKTKGIIQSPFLETILKYQYQENPVNEFLANYINTYSVVNYSNSQKLAFSISIPKSWVELEGNLPSTLKKFRSEYGIGIAIITVSKRNLSNNKTISDLINEKVLEKNIPDNSTILSINKENINGNLTSIIQYEQINQKTGTNQKRHIIQYSFKYKNTLLLTEYAIYGTIKDSLDLKFKKLNELFHLINKSIKINNNYTSKNLLSLKEY